MFKKNNPCNPCCGICEIGFAGDVIDTVVNAFPNGHGNANVHTPYDAIRDPIWGASGNKYLDMFYFGFPYADSTTDCDDVDAPWLEDLIFASQFKAWIQADGGKAIAIANDTVDCLSDDDVDKYWTFFSHCAVTLQIAKNVKLDATCEDSGTFPNTSDPYHQAMLDHIREGVEQVNFSGATYITELSGVDVMRSVEDDTKGIITVEKIGLGAVICLADAEMLTDCYDSDSDIKKLLGNFCSLPDLITY